MEFFRTISTNFNCCLLFESSYLLQLRGQLTLAPVLCSSKGKDRYPYPVGYHAVRHFSGISYTMQIQQGPRGPIFQVRGFADKLAVLCMSYCWIVPSVHEKKTWSDELSLQVTSTEGDSSAGQTPDIAWKNFQKKSGAKVRNWQRRMSFPQKIDGVEACPEYYIFFL